MDSQRKSTNDLAATIDLVGRVQKVTVVCAEKGSIRVNVVEREIVDVGQNETPAKVVVNHAGEQRTECVRIRKGDLEKVM